MKTAKVAEVSNGIGRRYRDDIFGASIRRITGDVILQEIKTGGEIRTIAMISPFRDDGKSELSEQVSRVFAAQGNRTLLLNLQGIQSMAAFLIDPAKSGKLIEDCIIRTEKNRYDYLNLSEIGRMCGFVFDKASFSSLLNQLKGRYRRIIIDTESLEEEMSGYIAASAADGVYFICNHEKLFAGQPERCYRKLKEIGAVILGIICNQVEPRTAKKELIQSAKRNG